jgi:hypothetical protein
MCFYLGVRGGELEEDTGKYLRLLLRTFDDTKAFFFFLR